MANENKSQPAYRPRIETRSKEPIGSRVLAPPMIIEIAFRLFFFVFFAIFFLRFRRVLYGKVGGGKKTPTNVDKKKQTIKKNNCRALRQKRFTYGAIDRSANWQRFSWNKKLYRLYFWRTGNSRRRSVPALNRLVLLGFRGVIRQCIMNDEFAMNLIGLF